MNFLLLINGLTARSLFPIQLFSAPDATNPDVTEGISSVYPCTSWRAALIAVVTGSVKNVSL